MNIILWGTSILPVPYSRKTMIRGQSKKPGNLLPEQDWGKDSNSINISTLIPTSMVVPRKKWFKGCSDSLDLT